MTRAEGILEAACRLAVAYVLAFHALGLAILVTGKPILHAPAILILAVLVVGGWLLYERPRIPLPALSLGPVPLAALVLAATYALFFADTLAAYPNGYDAISYHLLMATSWIQDGTFHLTETWWKMALPANGELFTLPALALHAQNLVFGGNVLATAILGLSAYAIGYRLSGSKEGAGFSAVAVLAIPLVIFQTVTLNVDIFGTAFLLAALAMLFLYAETGNASTMVLAALCCGISMGTKHVFIIYSGFWFAAAFFVLLKRRRPFLIALLVMVSAAPSALWVCRNWESTGNPFYPFAVHVGPVNFRGANQFPPFQVKPTAAGPVGRRRVIGSPFSEDRGLGPVFGVFAAAGIAAGMLQAWRTRGISLIALTAVLIPLLAVWWTSMHVIRFGMPLFAMCLVFSAVAYGLFLPRERLAARLLLTLCVAVGCVLCMYVPAQRAWYRYRLHDRSRAAYYGYPAMLDQLPAGTRLLDRSTDDHFGFLLLGRDLRNRVGHLDVPLTPQALERSGFEYATRQGVPDGDDKVLAAQGELLYSGTPPAVFGKAAQPWRVYRLKR